MSFTRGRPLNVLHYDPNSDRWTFDSRALRNVLDNEPTRHLPVAVIAVAGKKRVGKSMLLNYMLRYLNNWKSDNWFGDEHEPATGFESSVGSATVTQGIWIWSEAFEIDVDAQKTCLLIVDCEGLYGDGRDTNVTSRVFGITCALSSHLIFNVHESISTEDLLNLNLFVSLARFGVKTTNSQSQYEESDADCDAKATASVTANATANATASATASASQKAFQKLTFLVRSWRFADEHAFGPSAKYLHDNVTSIYSTDCDSLRTTKQAITSAFNEFDCYLMPDPNGDIYTRSFRGQHACFNEQFKTSLAEFVQDTLSPNRLIIKQLAGKHVTCAQLCQVFENIEAKAASFPKVPCIRTAAVLAFEAVITDNLVSEYAQAIKLKLYDKQTVDVTHLSAIHHQIKRKLMTKYREADKIITDEEEVRLEQRIDKMLDNKFSSMLDDYQQFVSKLRQKWLDTSIRAAVLSMISLAMSVMEHGFVIGESLAFGAGAITISGFSFGSFVAVLNLWRWFDSCDAISKIISLKNAFRNTTLD